MRTWHKRRWPLAALLVVLVGGCSREPKTYYDCVLHYVKPGMDDAAVAALSRAGRARFPKKKLVDRICSETEQNALSGRAKFSYESFEGILHNANRETRIVSVEIGVTTTIDGEEVSLVYDNDLFPGIQPLSAVEFVLEVA